MYLCTRRKIWTSFSCLVLLKCYHVVFSQFKFPANFAQLVVPKMHCLYANAVVQPSVQHSPCYMAWKAKVHTWFRHCHLCINAPMWREKRWWQGLFDPPSYNCDYLQHSTFHFNLIDFQLNTDFPSQFCVFTVKSPSLTQRSVSQENDFKKS